MGRLIIVRHGQSQANLDNVFAGWVNSPLTSTGIEQARAAGALLSKSGFKPDVVYASTLTRAVNTAVEILSVMGMPNQPILQKASLLERHYGALTGMDKTRARATFGDDMFLTYRRSFEEPPPPMDESHPAHPKGNGPAHLKVIDLPPGGKGTEALTDVVDRVRPFWEQELLPRLKKGENILISAHGNSLRALSMIIEGMTPDEVKQYEMDNAVPIGYDFSFAADKAWAVSPRRKGEELLDARPRK
jgi:2,3-bisphosphoglycerate-dependent phosphoglycerate mutase